MQIFNKRSFKIGTLILCLLLFIFALHLTVSAAVCCTYNQTCTGGSSASCSPNCDPTGDTGSHCCATGCATPSCPAGQTNPHYVCGALNKICAEYSGCGANSGSCNAGNVGFTCDSCILNNTCSGHCGSYSGCSCGGCSAGSSCDPLTSTCVADIQKHCGCSGTSKTCTASGSGGNCTDASSCACCPDKLASATACGSTNSCGDTGTKCVTGTCINGVCQCTPTVSAANTACGSTNSCGEAGTKCVTGTCINGVCQCTPTVSAANTACGSTNSCGEAGTKCVTAGYICVNKICQPPTGGTHYECVGMGCTEVANTAGHTTNTCSGINSCSHNTCIGMNCVQVQNDAANYNNNRAVSNTCSSINSCSHYECTGRDCSQVLNTGADYNTNKIIANKCDASVVTSPSNQKVCRWSTCNGGTVGDGYGTLCVEHTTGSADGTPAATGQLTWNCDPTKPDDNKCPTHACFGCSADATAPNFILQIFRHGDCSIFNNFPSATGLTCNRLACDTVTKTCQYVFKASGDTTIDSVCGNSIKGASCSKGACSISVTAAPSTLSSGQTNVVISATSGTAGLNVSTCTGTGNFSQSLTDLSHTYTVSCPEGTTWAACSSSVTVTRSQAYGCNTNGQCVADINGPYDNSECKNSSGIAQCTAAPTHQTKCNTINGTCSEDITDSCLANNTNCYATSASCSLNCSVNTHKYSCDSTRGCIQDDTNGTYSSSTCNGLCLHPCNNSNTCLTGTWSYNPTKSCLINNDCSGITSRCGINPDGSMFCGTGGIGLPGTGTICTSVSECGICKKR